MGWLMIEPDLTLWQNLRLRFWFLGMDLFTRLPWYGRTRKDRTWARAAYLHCVGKAGALSYGEPPIGPAAPWPEDL